MNLNEFWRAFSHNKGAVAGLLFMAVVVVLFSTAAVDWLKFGHLVILYAAVIVFVMGLIEASHRFAF